MIGRLGLHDSGGNYEAFRGLLCAVSAAATRGCPGVHFAHFEAQSEVQKNRTGVYGATCTPIEVPMVFRGRVGDSFQAREMLGHC
jgi:hypothetical protein